MKLSPPEFAGMVFFGHFAISLSPFRVYTERIDAVIIPLPGGE